MDEGSLLVRAIMYEAAIPAVLVPAAAYSIGSEMFCAAVFICQVMLMNAYHPEYWRLLRDQKG